MNAPRQLNAECMLIGIVERAMQQLEEDQAVLPTDSILLAAKEIQSGCLETMRIVDRSLKAPDTETEIKDEDTVEKAMFILNRAVALDAKARTFIPTPTVKNIS